MRLMAWLAIAVGLSACGSADDTKDIFGSKVCVAGVTVECACPGGVKGAQACRDDGAGYEACQCGGGSGSGGSAGAGQAGTGGASGSSGSGTGGAGGSCTGRTVCPVPEPGGAPLCGMIDDYCGGKLSCGCEFGDCTLGQCACWHIDVERDQACAKFGYPARSVQCSVGVAKPNPSCMRADGGAGTPFPVNSFCCNTQ
jgi:hypothetical protein